MKTFRTGAAFAGLLVASPVYAAQKYIPISDSLAANADQMDVKSSAQWMGKIRQWRFGEYAVVASKNKGTQGSSKSNLLQTHVENKSSESFSFVLTGSVSDSAQVSAMHNTTEQSEQALPLGKGWSLGTNQVLQESDTVDASISVQGDSSGTWSLQMRGTGGRDAEGNPGGPLPTNGTRRITLVPVSSAQTGDKPGHNPLVSLSMPAVGFEFVEEGRSLCALQYFGGTSGGPAGMYKYVVWMRRDLDPKTKLVLAAAMTTLLQLFTAA